MSETQTPAQKPAAPPPVTPEFPNPQEMAKIYAEVAERAARLLGETMRKQLKEGIHPPADEVGIAQTYMEMMARLLANPYRLAQAQMNLMWDYFTLWQRSMLSSWA